MAGWLYATGRAAAVGRAIAGGSELPPVTPPASDGSGAPTGPPAGRQQGDVPILPPAGQMGAPITISIPQKSGRGRPVTVTVLSTATVDQCAVLAAAGLAAAGYSPGEILVMSRELCRQRLGR